MFRLTRIRRRFGEKDLEKSKPTGQEAGSSMTDAPQTLSPGIQSPTIEVPQITEEEEEEEEEEQPQLNLMMSLGLLVAVTAVSSNY